MKNGKYILIKCMLLFFLPRIIAGSDIKLLDKQGCMEILPVYNHPHIKMSYGHEASLNSNFMFCPTGNITLTTQAQVNAFPVNYPGCTSVSGTLTIQGPDITNLAPLSQLTSIGGMLDIRNNPLTSLSGLNNITSIGGNFNLFGNVNLINVNDMSALTSIGGGLEVWLAFSLQNLSGFSNLTSVGGFISVGYSHTLSNLSGLHNVTSSVSVWVQNNNNLTSLIGLQNLITITALTIKDNPLLSECEIIPVCNIAGDYKKNVTIFGNAANCASRVAVLSHCSGIPTCPAGDVEFSNQNQVVAFSEIYPNCHVINGKLKMNGSISSLLPLSQINQVNSWLEISVPGLTSLQGLEGITTVGSNFSIGSCSNLPNLNGLNNLTHVGGEFTIWTSGLLTNLSALSNLVHIGGLIQIGFNNQLTNLNGLNGVTSTVGVLIRNNPVLNNISGLGSINLTFLDIQNNPMLSNCSISNVCNYVSLPANNVLISANATGCSTRAEVIANCPCTVSNPGNTIASSNSACSGSTINLTLQFPSSHPGVMYQWYNSSGPIQGANTASFTTYPLASNESFYCQVSCSNSPSVFNSSPVSISVVQGPNGGTASGPSNGLTYENLIFSTTGFFGNLEWQYANSLNPVTFYNLGLTTSTVNIVANAPGTYILRCKASLPGCPDAFSNHVTVTVTLRGDNVCEAIPLPLGVSGPYSNIGGTAEAGEVSPPLINCNVQNGWCANSNSFINSVWFKFTPAVSGKYEFLLDPSRLRWDSQFALYAAPACAPYSGFTLVAANDDATLSPPYDSRILPVCLTGGLNYYLKVDGYSNTTRSEWGLQVNKSANQPPILSNCPSNVTVCGSNIVNFTSPTATDDCGTAIITSNYNSGASFPNGLTTVTFLATDVEGATSSCSFTVNVSQLLSACPSNMIVCGTNVAYYTPPTSYQDCGPVTITSNYNSGNIFPAGPTTVMYTATNQAGNTATCSFIVTVKELLSACPQNFTVCGTNIVNYTAPASYQDCGPVTITSNYRPGDVFPSGVTTVTYMATSQAGHTASCSFEVKVSPEIVVNANITHPVCATYVGFVTLQASGGIPPLVYSSSNPPTSNMQAGSYNYLYTDAYGCTETAAVNIIAPSNPCLPPIPACGNIITVYTGTMPAYNGPGTADVYLIPAVALDAGSFSLLPGTLTRQVKRTLTNIAFNWTNQGACIDQSPNSLYNNNDKGIVYRNCIPVSPADFNQIRNFDMTLTDYFGTSTCSGRYKVVYGNPPGGTNPEENEIPEALTRTVDDVIDIFPNPGSNQVYISTSLPDDGVYMLTILDAFGKLVKRIDNVGNGIMSIETTDLVPGAYTMVLKGSETLKTLKWLKIE